MRRALATAAVGAALAAGWLDGAAGEDVVTKVGWWTANPLAQAPEGGGAVQRAADGNDITLTAVRVQAPSGELEHADLVLIEDGGFRPEAAVLQVCVSDDDFQPVAKGARDQAPAPDCTSGSAALARASTGTHWSADVTPLLAGRDEVTLVVVSAGPGAGPPVGYEVRFRRPSVEATSTTASTTSTSVYEPPPFEPSPPGPVDDGGIALPTFSYTSPDGGASGPAAAPVAPGPTQAPEDTGRIQPLVALPHGGDSRPWGRLWGFVPVSAAAGVAAAFARRTLRRTTAARQVA